MTSLQSGWNTVISLLNIYISLTSIWHVCRPETFVRGVHFDVILVVPHTLMPLQDKMPYSVLLREAILTANIRRIRQSWVRGRRCWLKDKCNVFVKSGCCLYERTLFEGFASTCSMLLLELWVPSHVSRNGLYNTLQSGEPMARAKLRYNHRSKFQDVKSWALGYYIWATLNSFNFSLLLLNTKLQIWMLSPF